MSFMRKGSTILVLALLLILFGGLGVMYVAMTAPLKQMDARRITEVVSTPTVVAITKNTGYIP